MQFLSFSLAVASLLVSAGAFAPASPPARFSSATALQAKDKPLTELCEITKDACEAVAPMLNGTSN